MSWDSSRIPLVLSVPVMLPLHLEHDAVDHRHLILVALTNARITKMLVGMTGHHPGTLLAYTARLPCP
jgi:hypothetical protein